MTLSVTDRPQPDVPGIEHRFVVCGDVTLHVAEAGQGEPLILLHGWPGHWGCWAGVMPGLADHFRVLAVDLRGFGWSDAPSDGYSTAHLADDIAALMDALELDSAQVLAHDWGGVVGFHLCVRHPQRVSRYMTLNTGHLWMSPRETLELWPLFTYQWLMMGPVVWRWGPRWVTKGIGRLAERGGAWTPIATRSYAEQYREQPRAWATRQLYRGFLFHEAWAIAAGRHRETKLTVPTLWLHGQDDPVVRAAAMKEIATRQPAVTFESLPGLSHFPQEENPELVLDRALRFFDLTGGDGRRPDVSEPSVAG